ncbi:MAG: ribulose-phosphate 3-epimerase [Candidatus Brocadiia bacterium]
MLRQDRSLKVAPAIMDADLARISRAVAELQRAGVDCLHVDIMDGHYVPSLVGGRRVVAAIKREADIPVDVHLMVSNPDEAVHWFIDSGADTLLFHPEVADDARGTLRTIHNAGRRGGIVLNPGMDPDVGEGLYEVVDCLLAMTVVPGKSGQAFMPEACTVIPELRRRCGPSTDIYVDGGIDVETAPTAVEAGANVLAAASAFFASERSYAETARLLRGETEDKDQ